MSIVRFIAPLLLGATTAFAAELRTLSGKVVQGELVQITDREIVLRGDAGPVSTPLPDILQLELQASSPAPTGVPYTDVELTDGSLLHCKQVAIIGKQAELTPLTPNGTAASSVRVQVPLALVRSVLRDAQDPTVRQEWQEKILARKGSQDVLAIKKDDVVQRLEGTFGDGDAKGEKIEFLLNNKSYQVDLARVHGMVFVRKADPDAPVPLCRVYDAYRNVLAAAKVELTDKAFVITTVAGARIEYPKQLVARLDYTKDKLAYLSDLEPIRVVEKATLDRIDPYRRDRNLDGGPLRLGGKNYAKGLALHSHTELIYDLDGKYKEFKALLGVDETVGGDSKPIVVVEGDGRELFTGTVTRQDKPLPLKLDVKGVKQLRIVVRSAGLLTLGDHVDFADAHVSK